MELRYDVCMEGACKSVQLHNIGSMCMTALLTQISLVSICCKRTGLSVDNDLPTVDMWPL